MGVTGLLHICYLGLTGVVKRYYSDITGLLYMCFRGVTSCLQGLNMVVTRMLKGVTGYDMGVTGTLQGC